MQAIADEYVRCYSIIGNVSESMVVRFVHIGCSEKFLDLLLFFFTDIPRTIMNYSNRCLTHPRVSSHQVILSPRCVIKVGRVS